MKEIFEKVKNRVEIRQKLSDLVDEKAKISEEMKVSSSDSVKKILESIKSEIDMEIKKYEKLLCRA